MANGSGLAITGVIIGIVVATQVSDFESADLDLPGVNSPRDEDVDSTWDEDADSTRDDDARSRPRDVPTQVDAGVPGGEVTGAVTSVESRFEVVPLSFGPGPAYTPLIPDVVDRHGVPATFCVTPVPSSCYTTAAASGPTPWLRWTY